MLQTESLGHGVTWVKAHEDNLTPNDKLVLETKFGFSQKLLGHLSQSEIPRFFNSKNYRLFVYNTPVGNDNVFEPIAVALDGHAFITFTRSETLYIEQLIERSMHAISINDDPHSTIHNLLLKISYEAGNKFLNEIKRLNAKRIDCEHYLRDTEHNKYNDYYIDRLLHLNSRSVQYITALSTDDQLLKSIESQLNDKLDTKVQKQYLKHVLSLHTQGLREAQASNQLIRSEITTYKIKQGNINNKQLAQNNKMRKLVHKGVNRLGLWFECTGMSGAIWGYFGTNSKANGGTFNISPLAIFLIGLIVPWILMFFWALYFHWLDRPSK